MFYCVRSIPFADMVRCVRIEVFVLPHVSDDIVFNVTVKVDVFEFICHGRTNNGILFCES